MKLNIYKFTARDWSEVAMLTLIFEPWLFRLGCKASPSKAKGDKIELPEKPEVMMGLVDLELEDVEVFLPPPMWDAIEDSIVKIESVEPPGPEDDGQRKPRR